MTLNIFAWPNRIALSRWRLVAGLGACLFVGACSDEIVLESRSGGRLKNAEYAIMVDGHISERKVIVGDKPGHLEAGEGIAQEGHTYVAKEKGGTLTIRDGRLVLTGMKLAD